MDIQVVAEDLEFPEGPIAMSDGSVILTEMKAERITRIAPDGKKEVLAHVPGGPNGAAIGPDGAVWITNNGGGFAWPADQGHCSPGGTLPTHTGGSLQRLDMATGRLETIYEAFEGRRLMRPNDLVFDRRGGVWFSDSGCATPDGRKFGGVYYARIDGSHISRQRGHLISPNGIGLSPDETLVYLADTLTARLWAFDVAAPGELAPGPGFAPGRVVASLQGFSYLDSLAVEAAGKVCVATVFNGGVTSFDPDGTTTHDPLPDVMCTNVCFGGPDMMDAWVTAGGTGKLFRMRWPRPGLKLNFNA